MPVHSFEFSLPQATLDDLQRRLGRTRLPPPDDGPGEAPGDHPAEVAAPAAGGDAIYRSAADWSAGTSPAYLAALLAYWQSGFDWRAQEAGIQRFAHFQASMGAHTVHFIHERGRGEAPLPLVLNHGFPDTFLRFMQLIPLLTDPAAHGGDARDAFHVVVPSMPGYAFSERTGQGDSIFDVGDLWHRLMTEELGYGRYGAHGGDWGSTVAEHLARSHAGSVVGIHLTDVPFWHAFQKPADLSPAETDFFAAQAEFQTREGVYAMIQGTRPQTLADGLNDSPAGLAAWLVDFFQRWSDGDSERRFSKDELLTLVTTTWATQSIGTSFMPYHDMTDAGAARWMLEKAKAWVGSAEVPAGFALFPRDLTHPPREWAARFFHVCHWAEMPRGGHFAALEEPELLAQDIRAFFRPLRP